MKPSKVVPLYKTGSMVDPSNFRPVSVLPCLSKIFEKNLLNQLTVHFNENNLLHSQQFGFTKGKSTIDAGSKLTEFIIEAWEESHDVIGVFCDLSKAFDCVCHRTLVGKLEHYGLSNESLGLLSSYLSNRQMRVEVNGVKSGGSIIKSGVPQGSILGPFLFLIYTNDLLFMIKKQTGTEIIMFADDTSILFKVKRKQVDCLTINNILEHLRKWFETNNLILNPNKTKYVKFSPPNVKDICPRIKIGNENLESIHSTTFLGITVDSKLQWDPHIKALSDKLSSAIHAIRQIRKLTNDCNARLVYYGYFHSLMSYAILLWGAAAGMPSVFVLQKRAVRAIYNLSSRTSLRSVFHEVNIITLPSLYIYECIMYTRKNINSFQRKCDSHTINTRNKHKLLFPKFRLQKCNKSFLRNCIRFYNKIPDEILELGERQFKKCIKASLTRGAYYKCSDYIGDNDVWKMSVSALGKHNSKY